MDDVYPRCCRWRTGLMHEDCWMNFGGRADPSLLVGKLWLNCMRSRIPQSVSVTFVGRTCEIEKGSDSLVFSCCRSSLTTSRFAEHGPAPNLASVCVA